MGIIVREVSFGRSCDARRANGKESDTIILSMSLKDFIRLQISNIVYGFTPRQTNSINSIGFIKQRWFSTI